jgi:3-deoxy-7-phosphoheptulonate synthase
VLLQMAVVLTFGAGGAGGEGRPHRRPVRQAALVDTEKIGGVELPSYRGDIVNGIEFTAAARMPDPERMVQAYNQSAATLNLLRAFAQGGYADLHEVHRWNLGFVAQLSPQGALRGSREPARRDAELHGGLRAELGDDAADRETDFFTSHEALLLPYEEALTRVDSHLRRLVRLLGPHAVDRRPHPPARRRACRVPARRQNPIGFKCGPTPSTDDLLRLIDTLNPSNEPGR